MNRRTFTDPSAAAVAATLPGSRRNGRGWLVCCPCHADRAPSLSIADADDGRLLVRCFAGCDAVDVLRAIGDLDLSASPAAPPPNVRVFDRATDNRRQAVAAKIWAASAAITPYDLADCYLINRGLDGLLGPWPDALRLHPGIRHPAGKMFPAMVAAASRWPDAGPVAVQMTALNPANAMKADIGSSPRWTLAPLAGAAVRLTSWQQGKEIVLTEGVEDGLAIRKVAPDTTVWSVLGAANAATVVLPPGAEIILALDGDGSGIRAAAQAARAIADRGHRVRVARLPAGLDPLDALLAEEAA